MALTALVHLLLLAQIVGSELQHTVQRGDSLSKVGARYGVSTQELAEANGIELTSVLRVGQTLKVNTRHIVPSNFGASIVVNVPQRMLFFFSSNGPVQSFPVSAGRRGWKTPIGEFTVTNLETDPTWDVPLSIQEEMRQQGKPVVTRVPPSPQNPLGKYWIGLSIPGVGIHGTNAPSSIYSLVTHGCVRLNPDDIEKLFSQVETGVKGRMIYQPVLVVKEDRSVFLEVHPDAYKTEPDPLSAVLATARMEQDLLDMTLVREVIRKQDGVARDVTLRH